MLVELLGWVLLGLTAMLMLPTAVLLAQVFVAVLPARIDRASAPRSRVQRPRVAILVPAHNEAAGIAASLRSVRSQMQAGDRLLVVADNCSDDTQRVARAAGAEVTERNNPELRGKGYALDHGIRFLEVAPPEIVMIFDADCELHPGSLDRLASLTAQTNRPVQALYTMRAPIGAGLKTRIAAFAWAVKNHARPLGNRRLGLPCQLMGTGMVFPWELIRGAPLASGHLVEDMRLGLDLAAVGAAPLFCPEALVTSVFPSAAQGIADQRARWEQGHVSVILTEAPRALWHAIVQRRPALAFMVLDLAVPPLTMLVMLLAVVALCDTLLAVFGGIVFPMAIALAGLAMLGSAVAIAWARFGRYIVSIGELASAPAYVLGKVPLYARFFGRSKRGWVRTKRGDGRD